MMLRPQGYATVSDPDAGLIERDTFTCGHCSVVVHVKPMMRPEDMGGMCKMCMHLVCARCAGTGKCDPFEKKLEREEASYHARRRMLECA